METESLLCLALCAFLLGLFLLLLAAAATGFAIGIERWLLLITYAGAAGATDLRAHRGHQFAARVHVVTM